MTKLTHLTPTVSLAAASLAAAWLLLPLTGCRSTAPARASTSASARDANPAAGVNSNNPSLNARATGAASGQTVNSATNTNLY